MSQYPSPYTPPPQTPYGYGYYAADPYAELLAPARRAGVLMIVLGSIALLFGLCGAVAGSMVDWEQLLKQQNTQLPEGVTLKAVQARLVIVGVVFVAYGAVAIGLGLSVRRGSKGAVIAGIVITGLALAWLLLSTFVNFAAGPTGALAGCMSTVLLVLFVLQLVWLIQGLRASSQLSGMQAQYQAQYWQHQQQQMPYGQAGGQAPAPPAPGQALPGAWVPPPPPPPQQEPPPPPPQQQP